jgi:CubicO group peptidase (beta-lactamase class C family)
MASCTKLQTTIAALQCIDRGLVALDDDVRYILTELKDVKILAGYEGDEPILKPVQGKITLRQVGLLLRGIRVADTLQTTSYTFFRKRI